MFVLVERPLALAELALGRSMPKHERKDTGTARNRSEPRVHDQNALPNLIRPLLDLVNAGAAQSADSSVEVIDREIESVMRARECFLYWVALECGPQASEGNDEGVPRSPKDGDSKKPGGRRVPAKRSGFAPGQFLRAWNDSTTRVVQLLKAREAMLVAERGEDYTDLIDAVLRDVEELPGLNSDAGLEGDENLAGSEGGV